MVFVARPVTVERAAVAVTVVGGGDDSVECLMMMTSCGVVVLDL